MSTIKCPYCKTIQQTTEHVSGAEEFRCPQCGYTATEEEIEQSKDELSYAN